MFCQEIFAVWQSGLLSDVKCRVDSVAGTRFGGDARGHCSSVVSLDFADWNRVVPWLRAVDELRRAA